MVAHVMVHLKPEDLPEHGVRVRYRLGELFEKKIEWNEVTEGVLQPSAECNDQNEPGLTIADLDEPGYAGFEHRSGNYWRYAHESDPDVFREHCLQIVEILEPFSPRSSWEAWTPVIETISNDRLRITLKNSVTAAEISYKVLNRGFGYQIKDLANGRRVQKILKHDYMLNQLLNTSFKKLDHHQAKIETLANQDEDAGGRFDIKFTKEQYMLRYQISDLVFSLALFSTADDSLELLKLVELPHSEVIEDTRTFLG